MLFQIKNGSVETLIYRYFSDRLRNDFLREIVILQEPTFPSDCVIGFIRPLDDFFVYGRYLCILKGIIIIRNANKD